jgi:hypothetical protein
VCLHPSAQRPIEEVSRVCLNGMTPADNCSVTEHCIQMAALLNSLKGRVREEDIARVTNILDSV